MTRKNWIAVASVLAVAHAGPGVTALAPVRRRLAGYAPVLAGAGPAGHLALTFDDGPDPASTPSFLVELERLGWHATFFMLGSLAEQAPGLVDEVSAAGHEVAIHGYSHVNHLARSPRAVFDDVRRARDVLGGMTGTSPRWLRPPYGVVSGATVQAARREGLEIVLWSAWGKDWTDHATSDTVADKVTQDLALFPGDSGPTVLLHDSDCTSAPGSWRSAVGALPVLAGRWAGRYEVGTVSQHRVVGGPTRVPLDVVNGDDRA